MELGGLTCQGHCSPSLVTGAHSKPATGRCPPASVGSAVPGAMPHDSLELRAASRAGPPLHSRPTPLCPVPTPPSTSSHHQILVIALWLAGPRVTATQGRRPPLAEDVVIPASFPWPRGLRGCLLWLRPRTFWKGAHNVGVQRHFHVSRS